MTPRGKLIALEGIDGSGKGTQLDLLAGALEARGFAVLRISFPRYGSFFGNLAAGFLNGDFGAAGQVDPRLSSLVYAGDRWEAKPEMESALASGKIVLADRYVASNLAHQSERVPAAKRDEFISWLRQLEYGIYGLPVEDLVVYLRVPVAEAQRLVGLKSARSYTTMQHDILEADIAHLEQTAMTYEKLASAPNWTRVDCTDAVTGELLAPDVIHRAVLEAVEANVLSRGAGLQ